MKKICLSIVASTICLYSFAQNVSFETAQHIASNFLSFHKNTPFQKSLTLTLRDSYIRAENGETYYYILNFEEGGYAIVSGDYKTHPILAYSSDNNFDFSNIPSALQMWLDGYENHIKTIKETQQSATENIAKKWNDILNNKQQPMQKSIEKKGPLTTSEWNQDKYYNAYCPEDKNVTGEIGGEYDNHVPNGCVAVSMAQIMYYHRFPTTGTGSNSYVSPYGRLSANFGATTYDYNAMSDVATGYSHSLAQLISHCGIAVEMNYAPTGSGSHSTKARQALIGYFKYANTATFEKKESITDSLWLVKIKNNIDNKLPIIYSGNKQGASAGHAWLCDGYDFVDDTTVYLHFNWGWGVNKNGWYLSSEMRGFTVDQDAIFGLIPSTLPSACSHDTLTATYGSFYSGTPVQDYNNNADCSWLISSPNATKIKISAPIFSTELGNDIVTIYAGNNTSSPVVAILSGDTVNDKSIFEVDGAEALITFTSNESITNRGFVFTYTTTLSKSNYCNTNVNPGSISVIKESSGTLTNGSGNNNYDNDNSCYWRIEPTGATGFWINVTEFNLAPGDELSIYAHSGKVIQAITYSDRIARYTIENPPTGILTSPNQPQIYIMFRSDNDKNDKGWKLQWGTDVSICNNTAGITTLNTYPNPCNNLLNVTFETDETINSVKLHIKDLTGKNIQTFNQMNINNNHYSQELNLSDLAGGIYILTLTTNKGSINRKIIVQ